MKQKLSIVIPFYNEQGNILPLLKKIENTLKRDFSSFDYEIIMVSDGSSDNTWSEIKQSNFINKNVIGIKLNRNYWQSIAMDAWFQKTTGNIIITLDGDGQNDADDIKKLYNKMIEEDLDIVAWWREKRKDPIWMLVITKIARFLRKILINDGVHDSGCTLRIYKKEVIENLYLWAEMHRYIIAIAKINGFKISELKVNHLPRTIGNSKYTWKKSIKWLIDLFYIWFIAQYNSRPLHLFWMLWLINAFFWSIFLIFSFYQKIFHAISLSRSGWLMLGIFFIQIGLILFIFGMMIDIMIRNYYNTSREKRYIIKEEI